MTSPVTEAVLLACVASITVVVLGLGWLIYLGRGGRPFSIELRGLGMSLDINRKAPPAIKPNAGREVQA